MSDDGKLGEKLALQYLDYAITDRITHGHHACGYYQKIIEGAVRNGRKTEWIARGFFGTIIEAALSTLVHSHVAGIRAERAGRDGYYEGLRRRDEENRQKERAEKAARRAAAKSTT